MEELVLPFKVELKNCLKTPGPRGRNSSVIVRRLVWTSQRTFFVCFFFCAALRNALGVFRKLPIGNRHKHQDE